MPELSELRIGVVAGTLGQGGAERQLYYLLRALRHNGTDVRLFCLTQGEFWEERVRELGVPITWVGKSRSRIARLVRLVAEVRLFRPQILQSQHPYTNLYAAAGARALGLREVGAIRSDARSEIRSNGRLLGNALLRVPRTIAVNSREGLRNAIALGVSPDRLHFLPNVVDTDHFRPAPRAGGIPVRLLAVGRLGPEKRFDRFIDHLAGLRASGLDVRGILVGDGPLRVDLERQACGLGLLNGGLEFRGAVRDPREAYNEADLLVLTSDWEGTPNVLLEAMACGLPVVANRVGGVADIVRDGETGLLADVEDADALRSALRELVSTLPLRAAMGQNAREFVVRNHSVDRLPLLLEQLYGMALS